MGADNLATSLSYQCYLLMMLDCSSSSRKTVLSIQTASSSTMREINHSGFSQYIHCFYKAAKKSLPFRSMVSFWVQTWGDFPGLRGLTLLSRAAAAVGFSLPLLLSKMITLQPHWWYLIEKINKSNFLPKVDFWPLRVRPGFTLIHL